jgi:DNA (cytosine-5)-methyltransferase 1
MQRDLVEEPVCVAMRGRGEQNTQQLEPRTDGRTNTLTTVHKDNLINRDGRIRRLTPTECARLQTIPTWYRWQCSETQAYKMLGNGWTVEVIKHIFSFINF